MGDAIDMSIHQISRGKAKRCKRLVGELVYMILKDESYLKSNWEKRIKLVTEVMTKLKDPQFVQEWLALLQQSNTSLNQDCANEIHESRLDSNQLNQDEVPQVEGSGFEDLNIDWDGSYLSFLTNDLDYNQLNQSEVLQIEAGEVQKVKEESQSINKELNQIMSILEKKDQLMKNLNVYLLVAKLLGKVVNSCSSIAENDIMKLGTSNLDQGYHGVDSVTFGREEGQLRLKFPPSPVHNQEMISEENQSKKVTLTIETVAGRLAEIKLANPEMLDRGLIGNDFFDIDIPIDFPDDTCTIRNYKVSKCNADPLIEILDKYPNIAENLRITNPDSQSYFMNSLAGLYEKIKNEEEMLELKDITNMKSMIQDMKVNGLQVSWLHEMLAEVLENKSLVEQIKSSRAKAIKAEQEKQEAEQETQKAEQQLAKLQKKRKLH